MTATVSLAHRKRVLAHQEAAMSAGPHTPGPWEWWTSNSWLRLRHSARGVSSDVLMPTVCKDGQATIDVSQADMPLIAAAPDMLDALKALLQFNEELCEGVGVSKHYPSAERARAAIAKAEGRTS